MCHHWSLAAAAGQEARDAERGLEAAMACPKPSNNTCTGRLDTWGPKRLYWSKNRDICLRVCELVHSHSAYLLRKQRTRQGVTSAEPNVLSKRPPNSLSLKVDGLWAVGTDQEGRPCWPAMQQCNGLICNQMYSWQRVRCMICITDQ